MVGVNIQILDINDNAPVFKEVPYRKNVSLGTGANILILKVEAEDKDAGMNKVVTYALQGDTTSLNLFKIDPNSGEITTKTSLGSDTVGYHNLKVVATDGGVSPLTTTGLFIWCFET